MGVLTLIAMRKLIGTSIIFLIRPIHKQFESWFVILILELCERKSSSNQAPKHRKAFRVPDWESDKEEVNFHKALKSGSRIILQTSWEYAQ